MQDLDALDKAHGVPMRLAETPPDEEHALFLAGRIRESFGTPSGEKVAFWGPPQPMSAKAKTNMDVTTNRRGIPGLERGELIIQG